MIVTAVPRCSVCVVEDEPVLREEMTFHLRQHGYRVDAFASAAKFYRHLVVEAPAVAVLDIALDGEDGLSVCRHLRAHRPHTGIVLVTGRALRDDRLAGLAAGADAYLTKPVDMQELMLLIDRLAARVAAASGPTSAGGEIGLGWHMNSTSMVLVDPEGGSVRLSMVEAQVMRALLSGAGQTRTHAELAAAMGLQEDAWDRHRIEVVVSRLRAKTERALGRSLPLRNMRGLGYAMSANERKAIRPLDSQI
jgi:DNA-binding response OmpR family regulator